MFNTIITTFQGFFSRSFWFGSFLPVAIFSAAHLIVASVVLGETARLKTWINGPADAVFFPAVFACLVVLAYALTPLIPLLRGVLDGSLLPDWLHNGLRQSHVRNVREIRDQIDGAMELFNDQGLLNQAQTKRIMDARDTGNAYGLAASLPPIERAEVAIERVRAETLRGRLPARALVIQAVDQLVDALESNASELPDDSPGAALAQRVERAQRVLGGLLKDTETEAKHRWDTLNLRYGNTLALDNPQATRIGDARLLAENYSAAAYHLDFNYIWPRLQLALAKEDTFVEKVASAQSQVDFAILSLALTVTLPAVWLPWLLSTAGSPWVFLTIGLASPIVMTFFYRLLVESQIAFGEVMKTAIDRYRFDVLKALHFAAPMTLSSERDLWRRLQSLNEPTAAVELTYRHPT